MPYFYTLVDPKKNPWLVDRVYLFVVLSSWAICAAAPPWAASLLCRGRYLARATNLSSNSPLKSQHGQEIIRYINIYIWSNMYHLFSSQWIVSVVFFQYHRVPLLLNFGGQDAIDVRQLKTKLQWLPMCSCRVCVPSKHASVFSCFVFVFLWFFLVLRQLAALQESNNLRFWRGHHVTPASIIQADPIKGPFASPHKATQTVGGTLHLHQVDVWWKMSIPPGTSFFSRFQVGYSAVS